MDGTQAKIEGMEDDMNNKFNKTDDLKVNFDREKKRMEMIKKFLN